MKFIQTIAPLLAQGIQILFKLSQSGEKVQLDILPTGKENKAGILVPPKSLVGTPEEIDSELEAFLEKYCASAVRIVSIAASADADLARAEEEAQATARRALEEKRKNKSTPSKPATPAGKKTLSLGVDEDEGDDDVADNGGTGTTQDTTAKESGAPASAPPASTAPAPAAEPALTPDMF
jgi:PRTRC genetic system protein E